MAFRGPECKSTPTPHFYIYHNHVYIAHFQAVPYNFECGMSTHVWLAEIISHVPHLLWSLNACIQLFNIFTCYTQVYYLMSNYYFPPLTSDTLVFPLSHQMLEMFLLWGFLLLLFLLPGGLFPQIFTGLASPLRSDAASLPPPPRSLP